MSEELKACPFCGKEDDCFRFGSDNDYIRHSCVVFPTAYVNIADWNTRPIEDDLRRQLEAAKIPADVMDVSLDAINLLLTGGAMNIDRCKWQRALDWLKGQHESYC